MRSTMSVVLSLVCLLGNVCSQSVQDKKYIHAHVLQDLESPQNPHVTKLGAYSQNPNTGSYLQQNPNQSPLNSRPLSQTSNTGSYSQNPNQAPLNSRPLSQTSNTGSYSQNPNISPLNSGPLSQTPNSGSYSHNPNTGYQHSTAPSDYSHNPYLPHAAQPSTAPTVQPEVLTQAPVIAPVVHAPLTQTNSYNSNKYNAPAEAPVASDGNILGPHIYSARATQYTGPQVSWSDLRSGPVIILVQNPQSLSYDMAYASSGLSSLYRDKNSQLIAKLLLKHSDKVGVIYPTNGFPLNSFPDFPIGSLILPQDMGLKKIFNFYPRYVPILFLYSPTLYQKVARETTLSHLGQYTYQ